MKKFLAVVLEMTMNALAEITFSCKRMARHGIAFHFCAVIGLTALSLLNCDALGQVVVSGSAVLSGNVQLGSGPGGAPLAYSARTDGCVNPTATPSSCVGGTTTGQAGATLLFQEGVSDPIPTGFAATTISSGSCPSGLTPSTYPAYCPAPMNATATDPDFNSYLVMASDENTQPNGNPWLVSWAFGFAFSSDETLATISGTNGQTVLLNLSPASIHAKTCSTSSCVNKTGIFAATSGNGDTTHFAHNASIAGSPKASEPATFYETTTATLVSKLVVTSSIASPGTGTLVRTTYADFANGSGGFGGVLPSFTVGACTSVYANSWTGTFNVANDGSIGYGMTGGYDWCPSWTPADAIGNAIFIQPLLNNTANHGFQATTVAEATGASEPNWDSVCATTCTDGGVTWTNIGALNGQGPGFDIVSYRPSLGYSRVNTRLAKIYRGTGNSAPSGAITTTDPVASTRTTGAPGSTVNLPDQFTLHEVLQPMDGNYMSFGPTGAGATLAAGNWNSGTLTCQNNGGSFVWAGAWNSGTTYTNKKIVSYTDGTSAYYSATTAGSNLNQPPRTGGTVNTTFWTQQESYCLHYNWNVATTLVAPTTAWGAAGGHTNPGYLYRYNGGLYTASSYGTPSAQVSPPSGPITLNPGTAAMSSPFCSDDHGDYSNDGTQDLQPMFSAGDDVPAWSTRYTCVGYGEVVGIKNAVTGASPGTYRFAHVFNTGNNRAYGVQQNLPVVSPLGDLLLVATDMMGTRGDLSTETTQCNNARGMFLPQSGMTLNVNDTLYPMASNAGNYTYNTTVGGLTSGAAPTGGWCQTANCTATWGAATVQNIGANTCRGDVVIVDLLSAHPASAPSGPAWTGILAPSRATDWTQAGISGGIPNRTTMCATIPAGASAATIQSAADSCTAGGVIALSAGSYTLSTTVFANKGIVFRGSGPTSTTVTCPSGGGGCFYIGLNGTSGQGSTFPTNVFTVHSWTGGLTAGSTILTLNSTAGISAGQNIDIDELNPAWVFTSGVEGNCLTGNSCGRNSNGTQFYGDASRAAPQMVHVVSVDSGTQITIAAPGVGFTHASGLTPQTFSWVCTGCTGGNPNAFGGNVQYGGIENMAINANNNDFAVGMPYCDYCWVKNVAMTNIARAGVFIWWSIGSVIRDSYFASTAAGAPTQYGMEVMASAQVLIENNICYNVTACLLPESDYGLVAGYNYALNAVSGNLFASYSTHLSHNYLSLDEGNTLDFRNYDNSWGSASQETMFRNRANGMGANKTNYRTPVGIGSQQHYENLVANVLGDPTLHIQYECTQATPDGANNYIYTLGWWNGCGNTPFDTVTESSLTRWGNWDAVTYCTNGEHGGTACGSTGSNGVRYCTGSGAGNPACTASETASADPTFPGLSSPLTSFPASFYNGVTSAHASCHTGLSFWKNPGSGVCPVYPPIGPDVTCSTNCVTNTASHAAKIPAQLCYENTAKDGNGFLTAFDAAVCYTSDP